MTVPTPLIAGNWKMNGSRAALEEARLVAAAVGDVRPRVAICPPATLIAPMRQVLAGSPVLTGAQDCHWEASGAFTGDISSELLAEAGAQMVILGHSERRAGHFETDELVAKKVLAALRAGLEPIICVGETLDQRQSGEALQVVTTQVRGSLPAGLSGKAFVLAYEPVWAIGTGLTPTIGEIEEMHRAIRTSLGDVLGEDASRPPILYGGSVKPSNAREILSAAEVAGALVGGASLKSADFLGIICAL